jgi:hypothetical protein
LQELERKKDEFKHTKPNNSRKDEEFKQLEDVLEEKNRVIHFYQKTLEKLKAKFS